MVVGPIRALLLAHVQAGWNRSLKELGKGGTSAMAVLLGILVVVVVVPSLLGAGMLGFLVGKGLQKPITPMALGLLLTAGSFGGGVICGIAGGARALEWERYRTFPLRLRTLFTAELLAGAGDLLPMLLLLVMGFLGLGLLVAVPRLAFPLLLLWVASALILLSTQHLVGALAGVLVKRLRVGLVVVGILAWVISALAPAYLPASPRQRPRSRLLESQARQGEWEPQTLARLSTAGETLARGVGWLPHGQAARGLQDTAGGSWGRGLLRLGYLLCTALAVTVAAARTLAWETSPQALRKAEKGAARKLWTFRTPVRGLGRLAWETLMGSHLGKFGFLVPLMTLVLLKGPFAHMKGQGLWGVPGAFAYLSLSTSQLLFNQFGLYHHGIKSLLLLPVSPRQLLQGQALGLGAYLGLQALVLMVLLWFVAQPTLLEISAGLCLASCFFFVQAAIGHFTSVALPRNMPRDSLKSGGVPLLMVLVSLGTTLGCSLLFGGAWALCTWLAPAWLLAVMAGLAGLCGLGYWLVLPLAAAFLNEKREKLVEALG